MAKAGAPTGEADGGRREFLRLRTQLSSIDDFVRTFVYFVDETTLFISSRTTVPVGLRRRFVVTLGDGQQVFSGEGQIVESPARLAGPGSPTGMRLRLLRVDPESKPVHALLIERRREWLGRSLDPPSAPASEAEETTAVSDAPHRLAATLAVDAPPAAPESGPPPGGAPRISRPGAPPRVPSASTTKKAAEAPARPARPAGKAGSRSRTEGSAARAGPGASDSKMTREASTTRADPTTSAAKSPAPPRPPDERADTAPPAASRSGAAEERATSGADAGLPADPQSDMPDVDLQGLSERGMHEARPEAEEEPAGGESRAASALPLRAPPDAPPAPASPGPRAEASREHAPAAPAAAPPARRRSTPTKKLAAFGAMAALAVLTAYLAFADRGAPSQELENPLAANEPLPDKSISDRAPDSTGPLADRLASVDAGHEGQGDIEDDVPGDDVAGEELAIEHAPLPGDGEGCVARIDSTPRGASVTIDGTEVGETPITDLPVECGVELTVLITHQGFQDHRLRATASPEAPLEVSTTLQRSMSRLRVETTPPGATVTINGDVVGSAPVDARVRQSTPIHVTATLRGYKVWVKQIRPQRARVTLRAELERIAGR